MRGNDLTQQIRELPDTRFGIVMGFNILTATTSHIGGKVEVNSIALESAMP